MKFGGGSFWGTHVGAEQGRVRNLRRWWSRHRPGCCVLAQSGCLCCFMPRVGSPCDVINMMRYGGCDLAWPPADEEAVAADQQPSSPAARDSLIRLRYATTASGVPLAAGTGRGRSNWVVGFGHSGGFEQGRL